jgi:rare lipoprotein A
MLKTAAGVALLLGMVGCSHRPPVQAPGPSYTVGPGYEAQGVWHYPHEDFGYDRTGLAAVYGDEAPQVTADGEAYDADAMAAASQTLQLPSIIQVTNLQTGRQLLLRVNDRGPVDPGRIIALTPKAAKLLGVPDGGVAEVRVTVQQGPSQALADQLGAGIKIAAAPVTGFQSTSLAPPPGIASSGVAVGQADQAGGSLAATAAPPLSLPVTLTQVPPQPGSLYVQNGSFGRRNDAWQMSARIAGLPNPQVVTIAGEGRTLYAVRSGPYQTVAQADQALAATYRAGGVDATITLR